MVTHNYITHKHMVLWGTTLSTIKKKTTQKGFFKGSDRALEVRSIYGFDCRVLC